MRAASNDLNGMLAITRRMLEQARAGEWQALAVLDAERAALLDGYRVLPGAPDRRDLEELLVLNEQLVALACARRRDVSGALVTFNRGRRAQRLYNAI